MQKYTIRKIENKSLTAKIKAVIKRKSIPEGQLVQLEELALLLGLIQRVEIPKLQKPQILVFASDHGFTKDFNEVYPPNVTYRDVLNILNGGAAINVFSRQNGLALKVVDMGVSHRFERMLSFWLSKPVKFMDYKISSGTKNFFENPAMTTAECTQAFGFGGEVVEKQHAKGSNILGFGVCANGSRLSALLLAVAILDREPEADHIRKGLTDDEEECITKALRKHPKTHDIFTLLTLYGGFEMVALTAAILKAAELRIAVILEGVPGSVALLAASKINSRAGDYCIFSRAAASKPHQLIQKYLNKQSILGPGLRSSDGSTIALAYPLIEGACSFLRDVADREDTDVPGIE